MLLESYGMKDLKYHIITLGCQMNHSDSERMSGVLEKHGMNYADEEQNADVVIINACSVRQKAIDRIWGKLKELDKLKQTRPNRPLYTALTGCVLPSDRPLFAAKFDLWFPMKDLLKLPVMMEEILKTPPKTQVKTSTKKAHLPTIKELKSDRQIEYSKTDDNTQTESDKPLNPISQIPGAEEHYLQAMPKYSNKFSAFVPIMTGCNAFCTYCAVPYTRGREVSRKPEEIIMEVESLIAREYKEITLLGQIVNKYMVKADDSLISFIDNTLKKHGKTTKDIPELSDETLCTHKWFKFHHLLAVINAIQGDFWLRFTSSHPKWFSDELIETVVRSDKIPAHVHLPVQAGSNEVLKRMLRPYTIEEYLPIIRKIRNRIPDVSVTTDCIVGFCGETDEEYAQTEALFKEAKYDMAFIASYSPRPGTKAEQTLDDNVPIEVKKQREKDLNEILRQTALEYNQTYLDKDVRVLVTHTNDRGIFGRTGTNKNVKLKTDDNNPEELIGNFTRVKISEATPWSLAGRIV